MNKEFIEKLKANAVELENSDNFSMVECIDKLLSLSGADTVYCVKRYTIYGDVEIYSFMTEEEMYQAAFKSSKSEYISKKEDREKERQERMIQIKTESEEALKTKFPKYKKLVEESFPKEIAANKIYFMEESLKSGTDSWGIEKIDIWINILEAAKTKPMREVQKLYYSVASSPENRLSTLASLAESFYSDIFINLIINDSIELNKEAHGELSEEEINEIIEYYRKQAEAGKPEAEEFFKKQDVKSVLKARIRKPIEEERKRVAAQKAGNNLDVLLGDESSEKGKTQKGSQKD